MNVGSHLAREECLVEDLLKVFPSNNISSYVSSLVRSTVSVFMLTHRISRLRTEYSVLVTGLCSWITEMRYVSTSGAYHSA